MAIPSERMMVKIELPSGLVGIHFSHHVITSVKKDVEGKTLFTWCRLFELPLDKAPVKLWAAGNVICHSADPPKAIEWRRRRALANALSKSGMGKFDRERVWRQYLHSKPNMTMKDLSEDLFFRIADNHDPKRTIQYTLRWLRRMRQRSVWSDSDRLAAIITNTPEEGTPTPAHEVVVA